MTHTIVDEARRERLLVLDNILRSADSVADMELILKNFEDGVRDRILMKACETLASFRKD
jgi:hypothetical protein